MDESGLVGDIQSLRTTPTIDLEPYQWVFFVLVMGYIPLTAVQLRYTGSYPAERHRTDAWSKALVGFHILAGSSVIYGGASVWFAARIWHMALSPLMANIVGTAAILHGTSNMFLLRKVPGFRLITVPFYIFVSLSNAYHGYLLLQNKGEADLLLVWNMVGTYIYVRYFVFLLGPLIGWDSWLNEEIYSMIYTLALPLAAIYGILLPTAALGRHMIWASLFACPVFLGPVLLMMYRGLSTVKEVKHSDHPGAAAIVPEVPLGLLLQTTDPVNYHGKKIT